MLSGSRIVRGCLRFASRLALIAVLAACGGASNGPGPNAPDHKRKVSSVIIKGNTYFDEDTIIEGLVNRSPSGLPFFKSSVRFEPAEVARDAERIEGFYRQRGYFDAEVIDIAIQRAPNIVVRFTVNEGEPVLVETVKVAWAEAPKGKRADSIATLQSEIQDAELLDECCRRKSRVGYALDHEEYLESKALLHRFFAKRGYAYVNVKGQIRVDRKARSADIVFQVDPGVKVSFGETRVVGLSKVPTDVVTNRISWEPGEIFNPDEISTTRGRLLRLGRFSSVEITGIKNSEGQEVTPLTITLREERLRELRLGGGAAIDPVQFEFRTRLEYTKSHFFFDPRTQFRARLRPAYRFLRANQDSLGLGGEALATFQRIDMFAPLVTGEVDLKYDLRQFEDYSVQGPGTRISAQRPFFGEKLYLGASWNLFYGSFSDIDSALTNDEAFAEQLGLDQSYRLGYFEQSAHLDLRDNAIDATKGVYLGAKLEQGTRFAAGKFSYQMGEIEARGYLPLSERIVLAMRGKHSQKLSGDSLPITRRLLAGGASSQRGFAQRQLVPVRDGASAGVIIGGNLRLETSAEVRWDVYPAFGDWLGLVGFVDAAEVTEAPSDFSIAKLHYAAGLGFRLGTLIGPIRADLGYRLNNTGAGQPAAGQRFAFHLSIGEAF